MFSFGGGMQWRSWLILRQKPVGSIPDGVIKMLHLLSPSGRTAADKAPTEISTMGISWGVKAAGAKC
jgi:hypothetical protein